MRIGMLADAYQPRVSGVTNHIALNKRFFEEQGHEVFVFTFGDPDTEDEEPNIIRSKGIPLVDTGFYLSLRYSAEAQRLLRTIDVAHVHHPFISGGLALRYCKIRDIPIVFTNHTRYEVYFQYLLPGLPVGIGESILQAYIPAFCRNVDLVISPSESIRQLLRQMGVDVDIQVVPNGVDLSAYRQEIKPVPRDQFAFRSDDVVLIYVGRLSPEKNLPFLLRAFAGVAQTYPDVRLLVVGDGPEMDNLEDRVRHMKIDDKVCFTGMVSYEHVPSYLSMADAFVTASVSEVHPLSLIEAMAAGLPILGIDSPGVGDIVSDGVTGFLSPSEDLATFTAKMVRLVTEDGQRGAMAQNARKRAMNFAVERAGKRLLDLYQELIDRSHTRKQGFRAALNRFMERWRV